MMTTFVWVPLVVSAKNQDFWLDQLDSWAVGRVGVVVSGGMS